MGSPYDQQTAEARVVELKDLRERARKSRTDEGVDELLRRTTLTLCDALVQLSADPASVQTQLRVLGDVIARTVQATMDAMGVPE